jgi:hypothetical protein
MTGEEQLEMVDELSDYTKQVIEKLMKGEITVPQGRALFELLQHATDLVGLTDDLKRRELARMSR